MNDPNAKYLLTTPSGRQIVVNEYGFRIAHLLKDIEAGLPIDKLSHEEIKLAEKAYGSNWKQELEKSMRRIK